MDLDSVDYCVIQVVDKDAELSIFIRERDVSNVGSELDAGHWYLAVPIHYGPCTRGGQAFSDKDFLSFDLLSVSY